MGRISNVLLVSCVMFMCLALHVSSTVKTGELLLRFGSVTDSLEAAIVYNGKLIPIGQYSSGAIFDTELRDLRSAVAVKGIINNINGKKKQTTFNAYDPTRDNPKNPEMITLLADIGGFQLAYNNSDNFSRVATWDP